MAPENGTCKQYEKNGPASSTVHRYPKFTMFFYGFGLYYSKRVTQKKSEENGGNNQPTWI